MLQLVGSIYKAEMDTDMLVGNPRQFADELIRRSKGKNINVSDPKKAAIFVFY